MPQYTVTLSDEEEKAFLWVMVSVQDWLGNAIHSRARQCVDEICRFALEDNTHTILTLAEKRLLRDWLDAHDIVLTSVKKLPNNIKRQIVAAARVMSAAERKAEAEAEM